MYLATSPRLSPAFSTLCGNFEGKKRCKMFLLQQSVSTTSAWGLVTWGWKDVFQLRYMKTHTHSYNSAQSKYYSLDCSKHIPCHIHTHFYKMTLWPNVAWLGLMLAAEIIYRHINQFFFSITYITRFVMSVSIAIIWSSVDGVISTLNMHLECVQCHSVPIHTQVQLHY